MRKRRRRISSWTLLRNGASAAHRADAPTLGRRDLLHQQIEPHLSPVLDLGGGFKYEPDGHAALDVFSLAFSRCSVNGAWCQQPLTDF